MEKMTKLQMAFWLMEKEQGYQDNRYGKVYKQHNLYKPPEDAHKAFMKGNHYVIYGPGYYQVRFNHQPWPS